MSKPKPEELADQKMRERIKSKFWPGKPEISELLVCGSCGCVVAESFIGDHFRRCP
jgi:hypothetical protein